MIIELAGIPSHKARQHWLCCCRRRTSHFRDVFSCSKGTIPYCGVRNLRPMFSLHWIGRDITSAHGAAHSDVSFFFGALTKLLVLLTLIGFMCDKEKRDEFMIMSATHFPLPLQPVAVTGSRRRFSLKRCLLFGK